MFLKVLILAFTIGSAVQACVNFIGAGAACNDIPTTMTAEQPVVLYQTTNPVDFKHPGGSFAAITCPRLGQTQALLEAGTTNGYFTLQSVQCNNGVWSSAVTFTCVDVCKFFDIDSSQTVVSYGNGALQNDYVAVEGTKVNVSCTRATGLSGTMDIIEGQSQAVVPGSPQTYTCSNGGLWVRDGAAVGNVACKRRCVEPPVTNSGDDKTSLDLFFTGFLEGLASVRHGTQLSIRLTVQDAAEFTSVPCESENDNNEFGSEIFFTDGTSVRVGADNRDFSTALLCDDGHYKVQTFSYEGTVFSNKTLSHFACE